MMQTIENDVGPRKDKGSSLSPAAVFRKILSSAKASKSRRHSAITYETIEKSTHEIDAERDAAFELRKQQWQNELESMSEFLVIKSAQEQRQEGVDNPIDTAYIGESKHGKPVLKGVFDVRHFDSNDIELKVENNLLTLEAIHTDDNDDKLYRKKIVRKLNLPNFVDPANLECDLDDGLVIVEIPLRVIRMPPPKPKGENVYAINRSPTSRRRKFNLAFSLGADVLGDSVSVGLKDDVGPLQITARSSKSDRQLKKEYAIPDDIQVTEVIHDLSPQGHLSIVVYVKDEACP